MTMTSPISPDMTRLRSERGFTLPELLVAMFLTMTVGATAFSALRDASRTTEGVMSMADVNINLRVAMNLMIRDLLSVGEGIPIGGISFPTGGTAVTRPSPEGAAWEFESGWTTLPAVIPGDGIGPEVNEVETDAVTLLTADRRLDFSGITVTDIANDGSSLTVPDDVPIDESGTAIEVGDLIMISNANGVTLQEVTAVEGQTITFAATAESNLNQPTAPEGSVMDLQNPDDADDLWPPTTITRVNMISYYIYVPTSGQVTSPHLIRRINYGPERVIAIGITNVQLSWDLVDGVTNPTSVPNPGTPLLPGADSTEHQIRKANLFMSARSLQVYSQTGQSLHASLSTGVSLRSLAFVSRYDVQ